MNHQQILDAVICARKNHSPRVTVVLHSGRLVDVSGLTEDGVLLMLRVWGVAYAEIAHIAWTLPKPKTSKGIAQCLD